MNDRPLVIMSRNWNSLVDSGLFSNLSAQIVPDDDNTLVLKVSGDELPSMKISPDITVSMSKSTPFVTGGVRLICLLYFGFGVVVNLIKSFFCQVSVTKKNFLGLGQQLHMALSKSPQRSFDLPSILR